MVPRTQYARSGDVSIAFQVLGDGPLELIFTTGLISHVEYLWANPGFARFFERLASYARLVIVDRRGAGLSDPMPGSASMDEEVGDLDAVIDAAGLERPAILAYATAGALAVKYAAERPQRLRALVLYAPIVRVIAAEDHEWAHTPEQRSAYTAEMVEHWGEGRLLDQIAPSCAGDARMRSFFARLERVSASPGTLASIVRSMGGIDVRALLPRVQTPTLVLHRTNDSMIDVRHSRYLAAGIPGARLVELEGSDNLFSVGDTDALLEEVEEFLTGERTAPVAERALLTVLFTDIVDGTARAAALGDRDWRDLLAAHDSAVRRELDRFGGVEVKTMGDGFLATFAGAPSQAIRCARAIAASTRPLGLDVRAGLHTGECELIGADVGGMAVHIAARVNALASGGEVLVSSTVREAVAGSGLAFAERGEHELRGVPGRWRLFAADGVQGS